MPDETLGTPSTSAAAERSISQLKPPGNLDFGNPSELPHAWKRWKEEITLYMDLAMDGREEKTKVKLFLYTIGNQGREIYYTLPFSRGPTERSLKDVIDAFETHCNPKKNETVERYKFFTRVQEEGEPLEKFIVDLKILASTCNFTTLRESLVRDRIICGIRDSKLREDLLKVADLDLDKCVNACRASNYRKKGTEELRQRQKQSTISLAETKEKRKKTKEIRAAEMTKTENRKLIRKCKFCGRQHRRGNCPAYGVECQKCHKSNHFASFCISRRPKPAHTVESDDDYDEIKTVELNPVDEINAVAARKFPKRLFATINVGEDASTLSAR